MRAPSPAFRFIEDVVTVEDRNGVSVMVYRDGATPKLGTVAGAMRWQEVAADWARTFKR